MKICKKCKAKEEEKCDICGEEMQKVDIYRNPYQKPIGNEDYCLHKNCSGCKNGTCNGVHMLSCPCKNCSPRM